MANERRAWSLLAKEDDRQYAGNKGYDDDPARVYRYDSNVGNHLQVTHGDLALVRDAKRLTGLGIIRRIQDEPGTKIILRCPECGGTRLKERKTKSPRYRCDKEHVFETPIPDEINVTKYSAHYGDSFFAISPGVDANQIRSAVLRYSDQAAIQEVDLRLIANHIVALEPSAAQLMAEFLQGKRPDPDEGDYEDEVSDQTGSFTPSMVDRRLEIVRAIKSRRGQTRFRKDLIRRYGPACMVSGCPCMEIVEAAHIWPYRGEDDHHPENGLLLRSDLHTLFDLDLMAINPADRKVHFQQDVRPHGYEQWHEQPLLLGQNVGPAPDLLKKRWSEFQKRI